MSDDSSRIHAEIVHVLFMDLVGYSLHSIEEQPRLRRDLREIVEAAPECDRAEQRGELIRRDLGDGMALVFARDPIAPAQCAVEIACALREQHPHLRLRMGIHSGPVVREGAGEAENVAGGGINMAQRVMDAGDAGHILVSRNSAEVLCQFSAWAEALHDLGECEVKHGVRLRLFNLVTTEAGSSERPHRLNFTPPALKTSAVSTAPNKTLEPVGGAVPLDSRFYIERPTDSEFHEAMARQDSIVLVKGARQVGKTSLLARGFQQARNGRSGRANRLSKTEHGPSGNLRDPLLRLGAADRRPTGYGRLAPADLERRPCAWIQF